MSVNSCHESPRSAEIASPEKIPSAPGNGSPSCLEPDRDFGRKNRAGRRSENSDALWLIGLQKFFVNGDHIIDRGRKWILRSQPVIHRHDFHLREIRDRNSLDQRPRVGVESAAVQIDQHPSSFSAGMESGVMMSVRTPRNRLLPPYSLDSTCAPQPNPVPASVEFAPVARPVSRVRLSVRQRLQPLLRLGTDRRRHRDDAGDVRRAIGIKGRGIFLRSRGRLRSQEAKSQSRPKHRNEAFMSVVSKYCRFAPAFASANLLKYRKHKKSTKDVWRSSCPLW